MLADGAGHDTQPKPMPSDTQRESVILPDNLTLAPNVTVKRACDHDWRVNPVVCTTTPTGDAELWMCLKCRATKAGPLMRWSVSSPSKQRVGPFDPETWARRG